MTEKKRILVVDDESTFRMSLSAQLMGQGYSVSSAADGDIAIEMLRSEEFDLILLDIKMPNVDGYQVLSYAKEQHPATKVIMLTGFADLKNALEAKRMGAEDFAGKPFKFSELLSVIERVLRDS